MQNYSFSINFRYFNYSRLFIISILLLFIIFCSCLYAETFSGTVGLVQSGDILFVMKESVPIKVHLFGVDAPEVLQNYGADAKAFTRELCLQKRVKVDILGEDAIKTNLGVITLPDGKVLNEELVRNGLAWWHEQYAPENIKLKTLHEQAKSSGIGLWAEANPISPWDYRQNKTSTETNSSSAQQRIDQPNIINNKEVPVLKDDDPSALESRRAAWAVRDAQMQVYRQQQHEEYLQRKKIEDAEKAKQEKMIQEEQKKIMEYQQELQKEYDKEIIRQQIDYQMEIELQDRAADIQENFNRKMINEIRFQEEQNRRNNERQVDRLLKNR